MGGRLRPHSLSKLLPLPHASWTAPVLDGQLLDGQVLDDTASLPSNPRVPMRPYSRSRSMRVSIRPRCRCRRLKSCANRRSGRSGAGSSAIGSAASPSKASATGSS